MKFRILHHDDQERLIEELKARFEDPIICFEKTEGLSENNLSQINMELEEEASGGLYLNAGTYSMTLETSASISLRYK